MHTLLPGHNIYLVDLPLLIVLISLVYSATRFDEWGAILLEALRWGLRLLAFLAGIGIVLYILHYFNSVVFSIAAALVIGVVIVAMSARHQTS
jgi:dolichyl-phosphate-mannose--protein O-mannosyl transferase